MRNYGSSIFFKRWGATVVDFLFMIGLGLALLLMPSSLFGIGLVIYILFYLLYYVLLEGLTGYTVGKLLFRIRAVRADGRAPGFVKGLIRATLRIVDTNPLLMGALPAGILWVNGKLLIGVMGEDYVAVMNPADGQVEQRIHTAKGAHNIFYSPDRSRLYVTNRVAGEVVALETATLKEVGRWHIPSGPDDISFDRDGKLWITERWGHKVAILDAATNQVDEIQVGRSPHGIYLHVQAD